MREKVVAVVDCNTFSVSCERAFQASLRNTPVVVLSTNDGCVVARSNEAKLLGIQMGQPLFHCQDIIQRHHVQVFSSNYSLYADMSARVMRVLSQLAPVVEVYSIDGAFLDLSSLTIDDLSKFGQILKARVMQPCCLTHNFAKTGRYASEEEIGEVMCQILSIGPVSVSFRSKDT